MTTYYIPSLTPMWGDNITSLWSAEFIKRLNPTSEIVLDDSFCETGKRPVGHSHSAWVNIPWASTKAISLPAAGKSFDRIVATHHRHNLRSPGGNFTYAEVPLNKLTYLDAHGMFFRMAIDEMYPTFSPTAMLLDRFSSIKLPNEYVAIHVNDNANDPTRRNLCSAQAYYAANAHVLRELAKDSLIVTTGAPVDKSIVDSIHVSNAPGWVKLMTMINARHVIASLSGFTAIAAAYRKRKNCVVVNHPAVPAFNMGPPPLCYSNYHVVTRGSWHKILYMIESGVLKNSRGVDYWNGRCGANTHWCSFETFDHDTERFDIDIHSSWQPAQFYDDIENCFVPLDAKYRIDGIDRIFDMRYDVDMVSIPMNRPRKR